MESFGGDTEENADDVSGHKSKVKPLKKSRVSRRSKKEAGEGMAKLSQSASDITAAEGLGSEEDLTCSQVTMGSRSLSHDSIFLADLDQEDPEPARVLSQENVHSKIKALQMKLQLQKMHLGPPPLVLPMRRAEDVESRYLGEGLPLSPAEASRVDVSSQGTLPKTTPQPFSYPVSFTPSTASLKSVARPPTHTLPPSDPPNPSAAEDSLDFSSVAQFTSCLDNSAARHRLSVKPRNQRASTKKRLLVANVECHTENNINHTQPLKGEEITALEGLMLEKGQPGTVSPVASQVHPEVPVAPEETSQPPSSPLPHQYQVLPGRGPSVPSHVLRVKTLRAADVTRADGRPHSSFIPSELKHRKEGEFEMPTVATGKKNTISKAGGIEVSPSQVSSTSASALALKSSPVQQQDQGEAGNARGIKRPGSGSFHFSITPAKSRDAERPRSGSFVGVLEQTEARSAIGEKSFSSMKEKGERKGLQPRGGLHSVGVLRRDSIPPWDGRENGKKVEAAPPQANTSAELAIAKAEEAEGRQEAAEEAMEAREAGEEEVKLAFGVKLRSTSQSFRLRADASSGQTQKPPVCEERCDRQKRQEAGGSCSRQPTNTSDTPSVSEDVKLTEPASSGPPSPIKTMAPLTSEPQARPTETHSVPSSPKEAEGHLTAPQQQQQQQQAASKTAPSEMSWMSLAMEKTRSFQQLLTGRFSRDSAGAQAAARPRTMSQSGEQTQAKSPEARGSQPSSDALKAPQTTQPLSASSAQTESQPGQGSVTQSLAHVYLSTGQQQQQLQLQQQQQKQKQQQQQQQQQQPPWAWRAHAGNKSSTSAPPGVLDVPLGTSPPSVVWSESQVSVQKKEGLPPSGKRLVWTGLVSEKAAFLERQDGQASPPGSKGVEMAKAQAEERPVGEIIVLERAASLIKDPRRPGLRPAESSPVKVPERPCDEKRMRKNVPSPSSPSMSPTIAPACQSTSDSGQPSWMELAKRKSMAWSDKSMD